MDNDYDFYLDGVDEDEDAIAELTVMDTGVGKKKKSVSPDDFELELELQLQQRQASRVKKGKRSVTPNLEEEEVEEEEDDDDDFGFLERDAEYIEVKEEDDDADEDDDDDDSVDAVEPDDPVIAHHLARIEDKKHEASISAVMHENKLQRDALARGDNSAVKVKRQPVLVHTHTSAPISRVLPNTPASSMAQFQRTRIDPYTHVVTNVILERAYSARTMQMTTAHNGEAIPIVMCLQVPQCDSSIQLGSGMLHLREGHAPMQASEPVRVAYHFLFTILFAAPRLTIQSADHMPNITATIIPNSAMDKNISGNVFVRVMSVWTTTDMRKYSDLSHLSALLTERLTDGGKELNAKTFTEKVCRRIRSLLGCPRDVVLLYHDLAEYLDGRISMDAFPAITDASVKEEMLNNDDVRIRVIEEFNHLFHGPDAPTLIERKMIGRTIVANVLPPDQTRIDIGDGLFYYPFRDILPHTRSERAMKHPDIVAEGLMQILSNMTHEKEVPSSVSFMMASTSGENTSVMSLLLRAARFRLESPTDMQRNDAEVFNRLFSIKSNEMHCLRVLKPIAENRNCNPALLKSCMQPISKLMRTGEKLITNKLQQLADTRDLDDDEDSEILVFAAPSIMISQNTIEEMGGVDIANARHMYGEEQVMNMPLHERNEIGTIACSSMVMRVNPRLMTDATRFLRCAFPIASLAHRSILEDALLTVKKVLCNSGVTEESISEAQRAFVRTVKDRDERHTIGTHVEESNPWEENTYSHRLIAVEARQQRVLNGKAGDVASLLGIALERMVALPAISGDFRLRGSCTQDQIDYTLWCLNRRGEDELRSMSMNHSLQVRTAINDRAHDMTRRFLGADTAPTTVNHLARWCQRRDTRALVQEALRLPLRSTGSSSDRSSVSARRIMCGGAEGGDASAFTNFCSKNLGVMQELMLTSVHELHHIVGIEVISGLLAVYLFGVCLTAPRDIPASLHVLLLGDTTTGKTIFLELLQHILEDMGMFATKDRKTLASEYSGDCRHRYCVEAHNEVDPMQICGSSVAGGGDSNANASSTHGNHESPQRQLLNAAEKAMVQDTVKTSSDPKAAAAGRTTTFVNWDRRSNKQQNKILTSNVSPNSLAPTVVARFFVVPLRDVARDPTKSATTSNVTRTSFVSVLRNLIAHVHMLSALRATERVLPVVDTSLTEPVGNRLCTLHLRNAKSAGCSPIFHLFTGNKGSAAASKNKKKPKGSFKNDRLKDQLLRCTESFTDSRLLLTLMNTWAPILAPFDAWTTELMYSVVSLCAISNAEDLANAFSIFTNIDITCKVDEINEGTRLILDDIVQAFLYCRRACALHKARKGTAGIAPPKSVLERTSVATAPIENLATCLDDLAVLDNLIAASPDTYSTPQYEWIVYLAMEWCAGDPLQMLTSVLTQGDVIPLTSAHQEVSVIGNRNLKQLGQNEKLDTAAGAAFWYAAHDTTRVMREAVEQFKANENARSPPPTMAPSPKRKASGADAVGLTSRRLNSPELFSVFVRTHSKLGKKNIVWPSSGNMILTPLKAVTSKKISKKARDKFYETAKLQRFYPAREMRRFDATPFFNGCINKAEHYRITDATQEMSLVVPKPAPAAPAPSAPQQRLAANGSRRLNKVYNSNSNSVSATAPPLQLQSAAASAPSAIDGIPPGTMATSTNPVDPACLARWCRASVDGGPHCISLVNAGGLYVTPAMNDRRHFVVNVKFLTGNGSLPIAETWRAVHREIADRKAAPHLPNIFDQPRSIPVYGMRNTAEIVRLDAIPTQKSDYYIDSGVAVTRRAVTRMNAYRSTPEEKADSSKFALPPVDDVKVSAGESGSLIRAAFKVRCEAYPILYRAVVDGLMRVASQYYRAHFPEIVARDELLPKCQTFVEDMLSGLITDARPMCVKYQRMDESCLREYPGCLERAKSRREKVTPTGKKLVDFADFQTFDTGQAAFSSKDGAIYKKALHRGEKATHIVSSAAGKLIMSQHEQRLKKRRKALQGNSSGVKAGSSNDMADAVDLDSDGDELM